MQGKLLLMVLTSVCVRHHQHRAGKAAGCFVVAIPDSRFSEVEKSVFRQEADVVIEDLTKFDGSIFGISLDPKETYNLK